VHYGDFLEPLVKSLHSLRRQGDFGKQHDGAFYLFKNLPDGPYVKLGLAAVGDTMQKRDAEFIGVDLFFDRVESVFLVLIEQDVTFRFYRYPFWNDGQGFQYCFLSDPDELFFPLIS